MPHKSPIARAEYQKAYAAKNKERLRAYHRAYTPAWRKRNPDLSKAYALKKWGVTPEQLASLHAAQGGACGACGKLIPVSGRDRHIDHCHATNRIRGLLCARCNIGIGYFLDNPELLRRAATYLEGPGTELVARAKLPRGRTPGSKFPGVQKKRAA